MALYDPHHPSGEEPPHQAFITARATQAHAGPADLRDFMDPNGRLAGAGTSDFSSTYSGTVTHFFFYDELGPFEDATNPRFHDGTTFFIDIECEKPFRMETLMAGRKAVTFHETWGLKGGHGGSAWLTNSVGVSVADGDGLQTSFEAPEVLFRLIEALGPGIHSGTLHVEHPEGVEAITMGDGELEVESGTRLHDLDGGPGSYRFRLEDWRAAGGIGFSAVAVGVHPLTSLEEIDTLPTG